MLCVAIGRAAAAQDVVRVSGSITTRVDGVPVPGAVVAIADGDGASVVSDASGFYLLRVPASAVHDGRLQLKVDALGLPPRLVDVSVDAVALVVNVALNLN